MGASNQQQGPHHSSGDCCILYLSSYSKWEEDPIIWKPWVCKCGQFRSPIGVAVDNDDSIYIVDNGNHRIQKSTSASWFIASVGTGGSNPLQFSYPIGIGFNKKNGKLYVCDQYNHRVQVLETNLTHHSSFGSLGSGNGQFSYPLGVAFDSSENVHIADYSNYRIQVFTPDGKFICKFGSQGSGPGQFNYPYGVALDSSDMIMWLIATTTASVCSHQKDSS